MLQVISSGEAVRVVARRRHFAQQSQAWGSEANSNLFIGSLLLADIEVEPLARKYPLKQCSQLFGRVLVGERPPVSQKHYVGFQPPPYPPQRLRP